MLFNSLTFLVFLSIVYSLYRFLPHRGQNTLLLIGSYVFYGWWDIRFLFLIVVQTALDFSGGLVIKNGFMSRSERLTASLWVIVSAFFFVVLPWSNFRLTFNEFPFSLRDLCTWNVSWSIFAAACILTLVANITYLIVTPLTFAKKRKFALLFSIGGNLVILGFFKYFNFFIDNLEVIIRGFDLDPALFHLNIILPVGISFYTFQTMSYTIDIYRSKLEPTHNLADFALFVSFFPHLVAGPIMKAHDLLPQLVNQRHINLEQSIRGLHLIFYGFFIKVVIADGFAKTANDVFMSSSPQGWMDVIVGTLCFTIQIYGDFSGYSLIAMGLANLFGVNLMVNFNYPYFAANPSDFWKRWHISLSTWLKEYLYFPLGGNKHGNLITFRNLMLTMLLGGIWHGAAWNFVLWGFYHGVLLCLYRAKESFWPVDRSRLHPLRKIIIVPLFFCLTCYGWILFRAQSAEQISNFTFILLSDFGNTQLNAIRPPLSALLGLPILILAEFIGYFKGKYLNEALPLPVWTAIYAMIFMLFLSTDYVPSQFIYFVF